MSKINRAIQIFTENGGHDGNRKEIINSISFVLDVTKSNASVYYAKCLKLAQVQVNEPIIIEKEDVIQEAPKKREEYDYGDCVPDFLKKCYRQRGYSV